jgi:vacuolar-type H+-ATPase subunit E/Vma4
VNPAGPAKALQPVREVILRRARQRAADIRRNADQAAATVLRDARAEAERILLEARTIGAADADILIAAERARTRRAASAVLLRARRQVSDELRDKVVAALRDALDVPRGRAALTARITGLLGPDATITPAPGGGLIGVRGNVEVDCSVPRLADHVLATTAQLGRVWAG